MSEIPDNIYIINEYGERVKAVHDGLMNAYRAISDLSHVEKGSDTPIVRIAFDFDARLVTFDTGEMQMLITLLAAMLSNGASVYELQQRLMGLR